MEVSEFIDNLNWRYATKKFDPEKKIPPELLRSLLEAARLAPSSYGLQPWKFFVVSDPALRTKLRAAAADQPQITDSSHLVVMASLSTMNKGHIEQHLERVSEERAVERSSLDAYEKMIMSGFPAMQGERGKHWMIRQVYIALGLLLCTCAQLRIDACPMEGFEPQKFDEILGLPGRGYNSCVLCAIGYRKAEDKDSLRKKVRFPAADVIEYLD